MMISTIISEHLSIIEKLHHTGLGDIQLFAELCITGLKRGNRLYLMGNGGSAADCQHLAAEFIGGFQRIHKGLPAIALTTDTSILTAVGNDYGFNTIFTRQIAALVTAGDIVIGLSTSGNSENIIQAMHLAQEIGAVTIGLTGHDGGMLKNSCDLCIQVPCNTAPRIQEAHILIGHIVCEFVNEVFNNA
ncbi:MAG: gmhA [Firmicutes bacterium]|nr:gmhA [Bacillota bacterium]